VRLLLLTIALYGFLLVSFWSNRQHFASVPHTLARPNVLQRVVEQEPGVEIEAVELIRIDAGGEDADSANLKKASTASMRLRQDMAAEVLSESKVATSAEPFSSTTRGSLSETGAAGVSGEPMTVANQDEAQASASSLPLDTWSSTTSMESSDAELQVRAKAEAHALTVHFLTPRETSKRKLKCIGWRNTGGCNPDGPQEPSNDLECSAIVPMNASGYCEVQDTSSGERFRVMRRSCNILRNRVPFRCINAPAFARFRVQANEAMIEPSSSSYKLPNVDLAQTPRNGIVMVVYPKLVPSAYATIRALRELLGCSLPIEIWFRPDEMLDAPDALDPLRKLAWNTAIGQISFHKITDPVAKRFVAKIYAIRHSFFDRVLFLDADNVPVRDPTFLFVSKEFKETGAIFWPDFWHPNATMFGLHSKSLLWELLDMPFVDMFEQESGQLIVDRRRHAAPLELVLFYATHDPNFLVHYKLAWGDKDLFRLAWLKLNVTFHMIETPPAMAGLVTNFSAFCGMTMVQHDAEGEVLFLHRNKHKLTGLGSHSNSSNTSEAEAGVDAEAEALQADSASFGDDQSLDARSSLDPAIWIHLMSFNSSWSREHYVVQAFTTALDFTSKQKCFGRTSLRHSPQFPVQAFADLGFAGLETALRQFAAEATEVVRL
jgi:alpha 1,2-mannosyltransferase